MSSPSLEVSLSFDNTLGALYVGECQFHGIDTPSLMLFVISNAGRHFVRTFVELRLRGVHSQLVLQSSRHHYCTNIYLLLTGAI